MSDKVDLAREHNRLGEPFDLPGEHGRSICNVKAALTMDFPSEGRARCPDCDIKTVPDHQDLRGRDAVRALQRAERTIDRDNHEN